MLHTSLNGAPYIRGKEIPKRSKEVSKAIILTAHAVRRTFKILYKEDEKLKNEKAWNRKQEKSYRLRQKIEKQCQDILSMVSELDEETFREVVAGIVQKQRNGNKNKRRRNKGRIDKWSPEYPPHRTQFVFDILNIVGVSDRVQGNFFLGNPSFSPNEKEIAND